MKVALAGNPNSGKTTLYNELTGKNEHVGNWAGVTVSDKIAPIKTKYGNDIDVIDLPGTHSINTYTTDETVAAEYIKSKQLDVIVNIIDATTLDKGLFFTTQLLEFEIPMVIALNKKDLLEDTIIDIKKLENNLKCKVILMSAEKGEGITELMTAVKNLGQVQENVFKAKLSDTSEDSLRYNEISTVLEGVIENSKVNDYTASKSDVIDKYLTNPFIGIPTFIVIMTIIFELAINSIGAFIADGLVGLIEGFQEVVVEMLEGMGANEFLTALLTDGIIGGVGAVVGFVPLVMVLMFLLSLVEQSGFMARIALIFDPLFRKIGLSGKSIIPMIVGYGCAIPGIMSSRTIKDDSQRSLTAMLTPFVPCGAKIPIIALFATAFFSDQPYMFPIVYLIAFIVILVVGFAIKKVTGAENIKNYFIIELPAYNRPSLKRAFLRMLDTGLDFIKKAGTIIVICNAIVFLMASFDFGFNLVEEIDNSILAIISAPIALLFIPLGIGVWQLAAAAVTGFIAKEEVVGTLAVVYAMENAINEEFEVVNTLLLNEAMGITGVVALSFMFFNLFTPPCFAALGAMRSEMNSPKAFRTAILTQFYVGYIVAMIVYQVGHLLSYGQIGEGFFAAIIILVLSGAFFAYKTKANSTQVDFDQKVVLN
ncbi:MAG: ferrous iron transporter B [Epulopiscium sp. Nuni2H_MBin003]|nr:MAG: ferrous iron transporter B [Epulopiscium sp. Nuni2H_MBin003]